MFLDPPYIEEKTYAFAYNKNETFNLKSLAIQLEHLDNSGIKWMMAQVDTKDVRKWFGKYNTKTYNNNQSFNKEKNNKQELIITNYS